MIFEVKALGDKKTALIPSNPYDAWDLMYMLEETFPFIGTYYVGCYYGYEDCVIFHFER